MSRSQTRLPADMVQRFPVLIVIDAKAHDDSIIVRSAHAIAEALHEHELRG